MIIMNIMTTNVDGNNTNLPFSNMPMIRRSWPMTWTWLRCHSLVNWHWRCSTLAEMIGAQPGLDTHTDHHWPKKNSWVVFGATKTFTGHQLHLFIGTHSSSTCLLNFTASNLLIPWFFLSVRSRFFFPAGPAAGLRSFWAQHTTERCRSWRRRWDVLQIPTRRHRWLERPTWRVCRWCARMYIIFFRKKPRRLNKI